MSFTQEYAIKHEDEIKDIFNVYDDAYAGDDFFCCCRCGATFSETEVLDEDNCYEHNGEVYCLNCIKASLKYKDYIEYIKARKLADEFVSSLTSEQVLEYVDVENVEYETIKALHTAVKLFCWEDEQDLIEWYFERLDNNAKNI